MYCTCTLQSFLDKNSRCFVSRRTDCHILVSYCTAERAESDGQHIQDSSFAHTCVADQKAGNFLAFEVFRNLPDNRPLFIRQRYRCLAKDPTPGFFNRVFFLDRLKFRLFAIADVLPCFCKDLAETVFAFPGCAIPDGAPETIIFAAFDKFFVAGSYQLLCQNVV